MDLKRRGLLKFLAAIPALTVIAPAVIQKKPFTIRTIKSITVKRGVDGIPNSFQPTPQVDEFAEAFFPTKIVNPGDRWLVLGQDGKMISSFNNGISWTPLT